MKTFLADMNRDELLEIYDQNTDLQQGAYYYLSECIWDQLNGELRHVWGDTVNVDSDSWDRLTFTVNENHARGFLEACDKSDYYGLINNPDFLEMHARLLENIDLFEECLCGCDDLSDADEDSFLEWYRDGLHTLSDTVRRYMQEDLDLICDDDTRREVWLENIMDGAPMYIKDDRHTATSEDLYIRDGDSSVVFETVTREYR